MYGIKMSLNMMPRPLTEEETYFVNHELQSALTWLRQVIHWLATIKTMRMWQEHGLEHVTTGELWPGYDKFHYRWFIYYGRVYISVRADDRDLLRNFNTDDWQRHRALNKDWPSHDPELLAHYATALDELIRNLLPGIKQRNSLQICAMPAHGYEYSRRVVQKPRLSICEHIGSQWLCEDCLEVYGLAEITVPPLPEKKRAHFEREWTKLTKPQRRLEILERDSFSCRRCHRSPLREYGVRLAVRHVVPVTEGGKTAPDNLETLCLDCQ